MRYPLVILLILVFGTVHADPSSDEEQFLVVRGAHRLSPPSYDIPLLVPLPKSLAEILGNHIRESDGTTVPVEFHGFVCDLRGDGKSEYFINDPQAGGSGGPAWVLFAAFDHHWRSIGNFQGSLYVFPSRKGWPELLETARGGGGVWAKTHDKFKNGRYEISMIEHYDRGTITKEHPSR